MSHCLSTREREVLLHFARGLTYRQIARRMGIATTTVDTYLRRIRLKSGAASGAELVRLGMSLEDDNENDNENDDAAEKS